MTSLTLSSTPPQNYLVEEILLGCILINPLIFSKVIYTIKIESFFLESHQIIYINLLKIYHNKKLHPIELLYSLSDTSNLQYIGGLKKIIELMKQSQIFIYANNLDIYLDKLIEIINNNYIKRLIIQYGHNIIQLSYIKKIDGHILYNKASHYLNITVDKMPKNYNNNSLQELIKNTIYEMQINKYKQYNINNSNKINNNIQSGFIDIDKVTGGLPFGDLIVLAGRPSMGKTSLAINIAYNILQLSKCNICFFSLEMSSKQILYKFIAIAAQINYNDLINSNIYNYKWNKIKTACKKLLNSNIYIYDKTNISVDYIEYISKIWIKNNNNIGVIIIDYLQLIHIDNVLNFNRVQELSYITRKLKMLAQHLNIPIITLSQLNRSIETRINKQPILSDLKESGCIDQSIFINVQTQFIYYLSIKTIYKYLKKVRYLNTSCIESDSLVQPFIFKLSLNHEYIFTLSFQDKYIMLTQNHKSIHFNKWLKVSHYLERSKCSISNRIVQINENTMLEYSYLSRITYHQLYSVYDISMFSYTNFMCNNLILHNSIEQDADIVLMLYKNLNKKKGHQEIIDLMISKNRHGPTGSCQLVFSKENTSFHNVYNKHITSIDT